uniref:Kazal-like domain-containing protein n=1 Tax=Leersia perrieri TaxID=77586 RepID=A0A0D9XQZ1_9ORYZ
MASSAALKMVATALMLVILISTPASADVAPCAPFFPVCGPLCDTPCFKICFTRCIYFLQFNVLFCQQQCATNSPWCGN